MTAIVQKLMIIIGVATTVLPAIAPLFHLDASGIGAVITAIGGVVAAIGGLYHPAPWTPKA